MPSPLDQVRLLSPGRLDWEAWKLRRNDPPFSDRTVDFLGAVSSILLRHKEARAFPDVATFAFFCRRSNIIALRKAYDSGERRLGRGVLFHVAPSNVPVNFAYSLVAGLLSGSRNIVRVSSKPFPQVDIIVDAIERAASAHAEAADRIVLVRYERESNATDQLSSVCDVRIIWGGDETIAEIRKSPIPARSFDVTFADRYSLAVIEASAVVGSKDLDRLAMDFYNDTYLFDQNACSAPHLVVWLGSGETISTARELFWNRLLPVVRRKYTMRDAAAVRKLEAFCAQAVAMPARREGTLDNLLWRVTVKTLEPGVENFRCPEGYFTEYAAKSLEEIAPVVTSKFQTLAYHGLEKEQLAEFVLSKRLSGIDRIVPIGSSTDFSLTWDGYDLYRTLTRMVAVK